ncbi:MAG: hypothetical protein ABGX07_16175 [Pirellulaceae bacterium]
MNRRLDTGIWMRELYNSQRAILRQCVPHLRQGLPTFLLVFSTLLLFGLLVLPQEKSRCTVTFDIQLAKTEGAATKHSTMVAVSEEDLSRLIGSALNVGVIENTVKALATTGGLNESRITQAELIPAKLDGCYGARIRVVGEDATETGRVAQSIGSRFLQYLIRSENGPARPTNLAISELIARESASWDAVNGEWNDYVGLISKLPTGQPAGSSASSEMGTSLPVVGGVRLSAPFGSTRDGQTGAKVIEPFVAAKGDSGAADPIVNVQWMKSEFRLMELRSERLRLEREPLTNIAALQRLDLLISRANDESNSIPMILHAPKVTISTPHPALSDQTPSVKPRTESHETDWIELLTNAQSQMTPLLKTHENERERLLDKVRELLPTTTSPVFVVGWADTPPLLSRWGGGISSRTFVPLMLICLGLSGLLTHCLQRLTAIERIHDLRELVASSPVQVVATVSTGVRHRHSDLSLIGQRMAAWIRRSFQFALLLYVIVFATAALTSKTPTESFLENSRETLGDAFSIFASFHQ